MSITQPSAPPERPLAEFLQNRLEGWRLRHQLAFNFWIHMIGIPMALTGIVCLLLAEWHWGAGLFVLGYALQWLGHWVEGNDLGEWAAIKRWFGRPYIGVAARWNPTEPDRL